MTPSELSLIATKLNITKPIMKTALVDNRLKIYLYGGEVIEYEILAEATAVPDAKIIANPNMYTRDKLREVGTRLGIPGAEEMNKRPLVKKIEAWKKNRE